jgi:hypothetical protein
MRIPARVWKFGKFWLIEAPCLDALTQGCTRKEALTMLEDWVKSSLNCHDFVVKVEHLAGEDCILSVKDPKPLIGLILQRTRNLSGMTYEMIRANLDAKSRNAFRQYETGLHDPGLSKLVELVDAIGYELEINLVKKHA